MKTLTIQEIAAAVGGVTTAQGFVTDVCVDNRAVSAGCLFVCIKGDRFDGHDFASSALEQGASAVLCARDLSLPAQILVQDTRAALLDLAKYYRSLFDIPVVGVTGSVGKTTVKEMTAAVLAAKYTTLKTEGNLNNEIGLPRTLLRLTEQTEAAVIEMGMSNLGEISRLTKAAQPTMGIIGNIGVSHIENLGSQENILKAKLEILDGMPQDAPLILNGDDRFLYGAKVTGRPVYYYGIDNPYCRFKAYNIESAPSGTRFTVDYGLGEQQVELPAMGRHNIYNALAGFTAGFLTGVSPEAAAKALGGYVPAGMRQRLKTVGSIRFIEDCYNASPDSVRAAFQTLHDMKAGRRIAVLGDMLELGAVSDEAHIASGVLASEKGTDILFLYGEQSKKTAFSAREHGVETVEHFDDKAALAQKLLSVLRPDDVVLVKGSRGMKLEEILQTVYGELEA